MNKIAIVTLFLSALSVVWVANAENDSSKDRNVTIIQGRSTADGKSDMKERLLEECIVSLPAVDELEAQVDAQSEYLREINGEAGRDEFVNTYSATIEINYMLHQKVLVVVTTSTIQAQEPVMKVVDRNIRQTVRFESNPANGDIFAGRSNRQYYFSTREGAIEDARERAQVWLKQQSAVVCPD
ncbi:hypothetical protein QA601_16510 [Chitinispirillales bacterium ANBcel5]|uniref:hypothetical protein n=1 Tax=Cellulosispirillum alkaliphilum TaxID=3039283 RepID=UPI002A54E1BE|nr:hypothetical protein [Chitinispirillales bacterium ANBcel5]